MGPLAAARRALALNCREGGLPCREGEKATLRRFIGQAVEEGETLGRKGVGREQGLPVGTPAEAAGLGEVVVHKSCMLTQAPRGSFPFQSEYVPYCAVQAATALACCTSAACRAPARRRA